MFDSLTLKGKFLCLESVSFVMFIAMAIFGLVQLSGAVQDENEHSERLNVGIKVMNEIGSMEVHFLKEVKLAKDVWIRGVDAEKVKKFRGEFVAQQELFGKDQAVALEALKKLAEGNQGFDGFISGLNALAIEHQTVSGKYLTQIDAHTNTAESDAKVAGVDRELSRLMTELRENFTKFVNEEGAENIALAEQNYQQRRNIVLIWTIVSLGLSIFLAATIIRSVLLQLGGDPKDVAQVVNTMASGNFSQHPNQSPVAGSLLANAYKMQTSLRDMIAKIKDQSHQLEDMARSLAVAARQITTNVNHESDAMSSMAAAIEEMSTSSTHISDQGNSAKQIADASRNNAEQSAQVVNRTVSGLLTTAQEIDTASGEVSRLGEDASRIIDVVRVIKDIADQTNLLALNAAIEAARAGEQGRGFAVVADEVRKLAERTSNATNEINEMSGKISEVVSHALSSMDKVVNTTRQGVADAETAQSSIASIQQSFGEVANVIEDISNALAEQNLASTDLAKNTERVAQMSGENSSAAQGLLNLANELEGKASQMRGAVEVFKV
jgi:methyl-accepting chemotaxis protein